MRSRGVAPAWIAAAIAATFACAGDPTLAVAVTHPTGLPIASTEVTVYQSPTLSCQDVEFGRLDAVQLQALAVADETIAAGGAVTGNLDGISRTENKIVVARGFDATGQLDAAGCVQVATVSGNQTVAIDTVAAATVAIDPPATGSAAATVIATDPNGNLIDGRAISWTVYGAAGSMPAVAANVTISSDGVWQPTMPTCTTAGYGAVHVVPPSTISGYAVQMQVGWASEPVPSYSSLTSANFAFLPLSPPAGVAKFCAIRHTGATERLVCLDAGDVAHDFAVTTDQTGKVTLTDMQQQSIAAPAVIALLAEPDGSGGAYAYAINTNGDLTALFGAPVATNKGTLGKCAGDACVDDAMVAPACGSASARVLFRATLLGYPYIKSETLLGDVLANAVTGAHAKLQVDSAGCVTQLGSGATSVQQALSLLWDDNSSIATGSGSGSAIALGSGGTPHLFLCNDDDGGSGAGCAQRVELDSELGRSSTIGFTGGIEPRLIVTAVEATGPTLLQEVLSTSAGLIERVRMPSAVIPDQIVAGQFDADTDVDLAWDFTQKAQSLFEVAYARQVGDDSLEALSPTITAQAEALLVGDLNGDGLDDIVALGSNGGSDETVTGAAILPMGTATSVSVTADPPCSP